MIRIKLILLMLISLFVLQGCNGPTLKATSEEAYKESLKKIYDSQNSEEKRLEIAKAILYVISNGSEANVGGDSSMAYNAYQSLAFFGNTGPIMKLDGKGVAEIIKIGNEVRKQWAVKHLPETIASYKKQIASLEEKKAQVAKIAQTQQAASIANVSMVTEEMFAHGSNKPMGFVHRFLVNFDAVNNGSLNIYRYAISLEIKDSKNPNAKPVRYGDVSVDFKSPLLPGTSQKATKEISAGPSRLPYEKDRYTVSVKLKNIRTTPVGAFASSAQFSQRDEKRLAKLHEQITAVETELRAYK